MKYKDTFIAVVVLVIFNGICAFYSTHLEFMEVIAIATAMSIISSVIVFAVHEIEKKNGDR